MSSPHVQKCLEFYGRRRTSEYRRAKQRHVHSERGNKRCTYHLAASPFWIENLGSPHAQKRLEFYGRRRAFKCRWVKQRYALLINNRRTLSNLYKLLTQAFIIHGQK